MPEGPEGEKSPADLVSAAQTFQPVGRPSRSDVTGLPLAALAPARYWGGRVEERSLVPLGEVRLGRIGFDEWFRRSQAGA
jgi:hypothetical protein